MKKVEISYNPYKMTTKLVIDGIDVCQSPNYQRFKEFIELGTPLQTWIEPIPYLDWNGIVNELTDPEINDEIKIIFSGRVIDFEDLKRAVKAQNEDRSERARVIYHFQHKKVLDDKQLSKNIEEVVSELKSDRFRTLVEERTTTSLREKYAELDKNYTLAKETEFYVVFAGAYSSGKSTLLNALIRHSVLPTSGGTCTKRNCRIKHDGTIGNRVALTCYDENGAVVVPKCIFDNDEECARRFEEITPTNGVNHQYEKVDKLELCVDLSHLYPDSINPDAFTVVLIDTPGMDSAQSSRDGINRHAEIALDAISMESKPMIVLCIDAEYSDRTSIGDFMREIIVQSTEERGGFNDRFLFLMNKSDKPTYNTGESALAKKNALSNYLTDSSKWGITCDDRERRALAENASHFVPRVFMTAAQVALAVQHRAVDFTEEDLEVNENQTLLDAYEQFEKKICGRRKRTDYFLSRLCDIPQYRKDEIEEAFEEAIDDDPIKATMLQCGMIPVEMAIRDYIERYAYPVKVRDLLGTFEDILDDVDAFTAGIIEDLKKANDRLGEKRSEREGVKSQKESAERKLAALKNAEDEIRPQIDKLSSITFDSYALGKAVSDFRADIESNSDIRYIRQNRKIMTGQRSRHEVEQEIQKRASRIKRVFQATLTKINATLTTIGDKHDKQIMDIFGILQSAVSELERSNVFDQGAYNFKNSILWRTQFKNLGTEKFASDLIKQVVEKTTRKTKTKNQKKEDWRNSWNPFKFIGSFFMDDEVVEYVPVDGYYSTSEIRKTIDACLLDLERQRASMESDFKATLEASKDKARRMIQEVILELEQFHRDIESQQRKIDALGQDMEKCRQAILSYSETKDWLTELKNKIKGE